MANKQVVEYLQSVQKVIIPTKHGNYTLPSNLTKGVIKGLDLDYQPVKKISYEGLDLYIKTYGRMHRADPRRLRTKFTSEVLLSRLYNKLGVNSATYYPLVASRGVIEREEVDIMSSQSLLDIPGFETTQAVADNKLQDVVSHLTNTDRYSMMDIIKMRNEIAQFDPRFAEDRFFGEFMLMHAIDNICLQEDRTLNNFFTYRDRKTGESGVITYDHERTGLDKFFFNYVSEFRKYVDGVAPVPFVPNSLCPVRQIGETYQSKLKDLRKILDSKVLGSAGEHFRRSLSTLNFSDLVKDAEQDARYPLDPEYVNKMYVLISAARSELCPERTK
ncbi:MAG: hypothetical protein E7354_05285 [Clostridiales bacterium]|nr:hypothetical protein [Clostridiales bacterium]